MASKVAPSARCAAVVRPFKAARCQVVAMAGERLRLNNLSPWPGSRRDEKRKGRGYGAGQGGTCGFGNRGQKCRSGSGPRPGFEGGQVPLYRRLPKLRGIAGGMGAGLPDFVVINLMDLEKNFAAGEEVSLETVKEKVLSISGRDATLPLKVLGSGKLTKSLTVKATAFSESAKQAIEAAGGKVEVVPTAAKWTRKAYTKAKAENPNYEADKLKKKVARLQAKGLVNKNRAAKVGKPKAKASK
eukprot:CAMPEP_0202899878 /NCGR_PEP_ID=MMETSP1392-20130828/9123_1 /ASSEMBLY_ACC=CAM_ASM_000868 /TAXON_ID=225041 /ORGANISM="Chlamydomonas chlamydogama, Strain SAG 11-48b" /LENGTH=242 /DNA_ID=CAMNT_0049586173 /DNA_START=63 /DNA_END=791 /DNA_ORIENTATION=+